MSLNDRNRSRRMGCFMTPVLPFPRVQVKRKPIVCKQGSAKQLWGRVKKAVPLSRAFADRYGDSALISTGPQRYKLVCPFHNDKNPSLHINDDMGTFHCFGCGASGSIIDLEQLAAGHRSIAHALKSLASRYQPIANALLTASFKTPQGSPEEIEEASAENEPVQQQKIPRRVIITHKAIAYDVLRDATLVYQRVLWDPAAPAGLQYFMRERKLSAPTLRAFACGYAPPSTQADFLLCTLRDMGYPAEHLAIAGVARSPRENLCFDIFRDRVITPIRDIKGQTIALAGRALPNASKNAPKYINSPETFLFKKKQTLFGADIAKTAPSANSKNGYIVVVEGYMDVMTIFDRTQGRIACVATMGTAVTLEQLHSAYQLLTDCADGRVIVNFDNDEAGIKAVQRICESVILGAACAHAIYVALPPSPVKDADEFMREVGTPNEYVTYLLDTARPWYEWYGNTIVQKEVERLLDPSTDTNVADDLGITPEDMGSVGIAQSGQQFDFILADFMRRQRDDMLASFGAPPEVDEICGVKKLKRAPCSRKVLDELASVVNSANRTLPGLNVSALVHSWSDSLSLGEPAKLMRMYTYILKRYKELSRPWRHLSVPVQVQWLPTPPWILKELKKSKKIAQKKASLSSMGEKEEDIKVSPKELKRIRERIQFQERYILPGLKERRCEQSKLTKSAPRRAAEEFILRTLIFAEEIDRIDAMEILIGAIIRCAEKKLPFWTSKERESLFEYISELEGAPTVEEMVAYLEEMDWWCQEVENMFTPIDVETDPEWAAIRQLEIDHPIDVVKACAYSVERMAGMVASRNAIEESGDIMQRLVQEQAAAASTDDASREDFVMHSRQLIDRSNELSKSIDRTAYLNPEEAAEREEAMKEVNTRLRKAELKEKLLEDIESGDFSPPERRDIASKTEGTK
ncbi:DNA primase [Gracilariopsis chorda]|uniref:DNA primase n=1 Tax=Gracilariopsis chorda TaxID=448386 RepID=A0A2V3IEW5_9FLOR|nr:DNA primase [Gracilariopsis chorda]|eukprot:PXF40603.1 DNA primase [Gracilariopsis chorda]